MKYWDDESNPIQIHLTLQQLAERTAVTEDVTGAAGKWDIQTSALRLILHN